MDILLFIFVSIPAGGFLYYTYRDGSIDNSLEIRLITLFHALFYVVCGTTIMLPAGQIYKQYMSLAAIFISIGLITYELSNQKAPVFEDSRSWRGSYIRRLDKNHSARARIFRQALTYFFVVIALILYTTYISDIIFGKRYIKECSSYDIADCKTVD